MNEVEGVEELRYTTVHLPDLRRKDGLAPIRQELGIESFGINAWVGRDIGDQLVPQHDEADLGLEEVYIVISGRATFLIDGDQVDAPTGTIIYPHTADVLRGATAAEPFTTVLAAGGTPGQVYTPNGWETSRLVIMYLEDKQYDEAIEVMNEALHSDPQNPYFFYNRACAEALGGYVDNAIEDLAAAFERDASMRESAAQDSDLVPLHQDPRYAALMQQG